MGRMVLFMSMSLDGFIAGPEEDLTHPLGLEGERLHAWGEPRTDSSGELTPAGSLLAEYDETGAVLTGRRTYDLAGGWGGDHHGVPVVVVTHAAPTRVPEGPSEFTFVTDGVSNAVAAAKEKAAGKDVLVHGADLAQQLLRLRLLDEVQLHVVPVLLGRGRRLFDRLAEVPVELEVIRVVDTPEATHLRYRVVHPHLP